MPSINIRLRVFVPKEVMDLAAVSRNIEHVLTQKTAPDLRDEFNKTTTTWSDRPNFRTEHYYGVREKWVRVYTDAENYCLVNVGAKRHPIPPRHAKMLRFQTGYRPKTRPRLIRSFAGGKFGPYISTPFVPNHPGFKAREFDKTIAEEYQDTFAEDIQDAIKDALP